MRTRPASAAPRATDVSRILADEGLEPAGNRRVHSFAHGCVGEKQVVLAGESGDRDQVGQVEAALGDNERVQDRVGGEDPFVPFVAEIGRRGHHGQDWALQVYVLLDRFVPGHDG